MNWAQVKQGPLAGQPFKISYDKTSPRVAIREVKVPVTGRKRATKYMVQTFDNKWRRVYSHTENGVKTFYVVHEGSPTIVEIL